MQALRAVAALYVVLFHSTVLWHDKFAPRLVPWENGNAGVDLFFVISGFIMVLSSRRLLGRKNAWWRFMELRLIRVVPLYWLVTLAKLAAVVAVPALALHTHPTTWNTIASLLFIPARDAVGVIRPPLDAGWTLSFEMLFYLVFASALLLRLAPLKIVAPVMALLAALSFLRTSTAPAITVLASPIVLEFVFGALAGQAFLSRSWHKFSSPWMIALSATGLLCLTLLPADGIWHRTLIWGLAATAALAGAVLAERWLDPFIPRLFERIGESSYSLYLTHGFVLPVIGLLIAKTSLTGNWRGAALISASLIISTIFALGVYRCIETPLITTLRTLAAGRRRTTLAAPQTAI